MAPLFSCSTRMMIPKEKRAKKAKYNRCHRTNNLC